MCIRKRKSNWIKDKISAAYKLLADERFADLMHIINELESSKREAGSFFTFKVEGFYDSRIEKAEYYFALGSFLSAFPERNKDALEAFCLYNVNQLQKKDGQEHKDAKHFYSFRRANEYSFADLADNTITLVSPKLMNDPQDTLMYPWLKARAKVVADKMKGMNLSQNYLATLENSSRMFNESQEFYKIRSFCFWEKTDKQPPYENVLMWSHYAESHTGFCVVYELSPQMRFNQTQSSYITLERMTYKSGKVDLMKENNFQGKDALVAKSSEWEYEHEFRFLMYDPSIKDKYYPLKLDSNSSIYAIIFGLKSTDSTRSIIRSILKDRKVKYFEIQEDLTDIYKLKCVPLTD